MHETSFIFNNQTIQYYTKISSHLQQTERLVELGLVQKILEQHGENKNLIEIGCVSPYYFSTKHLVYDLQDTHPINIRKNAKDVDIRNKNVLSISTVEHFNVSGYNISETEFLDPMRWIEQVIHISNKYFITFPLGFNKDLDKHLFASSINSTFLSRLTNSNIWIQKDITELTLNDKTYDFNYITCANSISIIQNLL